MQKLALLTTAITLFAGCASNQTARRGDAIPGPSIASHWKPTTRIHDYQPGESSQSDPSAVGSAAQGASGSSSSSGANAPKK